jgi:hypothetical protein
MTITTAVSWQASLTIISPDLSQGGKQQYLTCVIYWQPISLNQMALKPIMSLVDALLEYMPHPSLQDDAKLIENHTILEIHLNEESNPTKNQILSRHSRDVSNCPKKVCRRFGFSPL